MTDEKAREILKKHCAAYGDSKYEPARWVIEALQDAVSAEREACAIVGAREAEKCLNFPDGQRVADAIRARSNAGVTGAELAERPR